MKVVFITVFTLYFNLTSVAVTNEVASNDCWVGPQVVPLNKIADNVPYVSGQNPDQRLDIYVPGSPPPYKPVVLIHGGCFMYGSKDAADVKPMIQRLTNAGYAVISVNYRKADPDNPHAAMRNLYPAALEDVQDALRWVRKNARKYALSAKVVVFGYSAGATLAADLVTREVTGTDADRIPELSRRADAAIDFFGRTDFTQTDPKTKPDCAEKYLGKARTAENLEEFRKAGVLPYVDGKTSHVLIVHGDADELLDYEHSVKFRKALVAANPGMSRGDLDKFFPLVIIQGGHHMFSPAGKPAWSNSAQTNEAWRHVCSFLAREFGTERIVVSHEHGGNQEAGQLRF